MKRIYRFSKDGCDWPDNDLSTTKKVLGGKGQSLVSMSTMGLPVPPGFTITTAVCNEYRKMQEAGTLSQEWVAGLLAEVEANIEWLKSQFGYTPLMSVRSGAPISMPGMMDTILNVGLHYGNLVDWQDRIGARAANDSMRRLIQMLGSTAYGVPHGVFEFQLAKLKKEVGAESDTALTADALGGVVSRYLTAFLGNKGFAFPVEDPAEQLKAAIFAVFSSWMNPRAIEYRKLNHISDDMGTAVTVQAMVFGNMGEDSGTGVLFTRNPSTGEPGMTGEFLQNAQGEDVVAGIRTPENVHKMGEMFDPWYHCYGQLKKLCDDLEATYKDMVDIEFTVQKGELFVLQSRVGKRSAAAAFKIAVDMVKSEQITIDQALSRITPEQLKVVRRPIVDPAYKVPPDYTGLPACPGVATGIPVFTKDDAVNCKVPCILVTHETTPDDIAGMAKAVGILTQTGGATSHAAVVARAMDKPCITGCIDMDIEALKKWEGHEVVVIDGGSGKVWLGKDVPVIDNSNNPAVKQVMQWCLAKTGANMASAVDLEKGVAHTIYAALWWGDDEVLEAIIDGLRDRGVDGVVLDMHEPSHFTEDADVDLRLAFGNLEEGHEPAPWAHKMVMALCKAKGLEGLVIVGARAADFGKLQEAGYKVHCESKPTTIAQLMHNFTTEPPAEFIQNVVGGMKEWHKLRDMMLANGFKESVVQRALPIEYAAFTVLGAA